MSRLTLLFASLLAACTADSGGATDVDDPFDNEAEAVLTDLDKAWYVCTDGDVGFDLVFDSGDQIGVLVGEDLLLGTYERGSDTLRLRVPDTGFDETTLAIEIGIGLLVRFETPSIRCTIVGTDYEIDTSEDTYTCPNINHQTGVSYEWNRFHLTGGGSARWEAFTELTSVPDTLRTTRLGAYRTDGDALYMVFGSNDPQTDSIYFSATVQADTFFVDQLNPEDGACE